MANPIERINQFTNQCLKDVKLMYEDQEMPEDQRLVKASGYCHNIRVNKRMIFVVFRKDERTVQLIVFKKDSPETYELLKELGSESTVEVQGVIVDAKVKTCTVTDYEIKLQSATVISRAKELAFSLDYANETFQSANSANIEPELSEGETDEKENARCKVDRHTRLNNRWLDLRIPMNQKIFKLRSALEHNLQSEVMGRGFVKIHTPKIIPAVSEGGANVFEVTYFGKKVYLAQSPQLYKQMMINSGFNGVFEFGPVFRAENANTYRHLCEFTGFDMEFAINPGETHLKIIETIWSVLYNAFQRFWEENEADIQYVMERTGTEILVFPEKPVILDFKEGVQMLNDAGIDQNPLEDIGTVNEKLLGEMVKTKYGTDVYVLSGFPNAARPFYTMKEDEKYSRSFDFMMRFNEISSGAQRNHDPEVLKQMIASHGIELNGESGLEDYVRSFENGSMPHGGCGIGLERLVMLYLGLQNIRTTSLFPRDPKRITP